MKHSVGDLVHGGWGLGAITKINLYGNYEVEWYCDAAPSLRTEFQYHEITNMRTVLIEVVYGRGPQNW